MRSLDPLRKRQFAYACQGGVGSVSVDRCFGVSVLGVSYVFEPKERSACY